MSIGLVAALSVGIVAGGVIAVSFGVFVVGVDGVSVVVGAGAIAVESAGVVSSVLPPQAEKTRPVARSAVNRNARIFMIVKLVSK